MRTKKLTDYTYSPTNPASEDAIRLQIDDSIQEVYDFTTTSDLASITVPTAIEEVYSKAKAVVPVLEITEARTSSVYGSFTTLKERTDNSDIKIRELAINVKDFGAKGDGTTDDRASIQNAFNALSDGGILFIPSSVSYYKIVNATGTGANVVDQRANAVLNNTLYPITCSKNNITVVIQGKIKETSILGNIFEFSGKNVLICGNGSVNGVGGNDDDGFLDTNSTDPTQQWLPSLIKCTGERSLVTNISLIDPPTVGVYFNGELSKCEDVTISGGRVIHGTGTAHFGVMFDIGATNSIASNVKITENQLGGKVYSGFYNLASFCKILFNQIKSIHEHGVYNYGDDTEISGNNIDSADSLAGSIQSFSEGLIIEKNIIKNAVNGAIGIAKGKKSIIKDNVATGCGIGGVSYRTFFSSPSGYVLEDVIIENNYFEFNKLINRQSGVDVQVDYNGKNIKIKNNTIKSAGGATIPALKAGIIVSSGTGYLIEDCKIESNFITDCDGYGIYLRRIKNSKVSNNNLIDNATGGFGLNEGIRYFDLENVEFEGNFFNETRSTQIHNYAIYEDTGSTNNVFKNNTALRYLQANPFRMIISPNYLRFGNKKKLMPLSGIFTMPNVNSKNFVNSDSNGIDNIMLGATIILTPLNNAAATLQGSSKRLLVTAIDGNGIMQVQTADLTLPGVATAQFRWEVIQ